MNLFLRPYTPDQLTIPLSKLSWFSSLPRGHGGQPMSAGQAGGGGGSQRGQRAAVIVTSGGPQHQQRYRTFQSSR